MSAHNDEIVHISDTALMTAACRARETSRPDGFVRDPFAERLAGERGKAILEALPQPDMMCFGVGIRSRFLDELVIHCAGSLGVRTVLSVGCGLDTRPWRLELPAEMNWIEVDFPAILDYKANLLAGEKPKCVLGRSATDVNDPAQVEKLFELAGDGPALMITEGLLMYLAAGAIEGLAAKAGASGVSYWISDITSPAFAQMVGMDSYTSIQQMRAESHLDGLQILEVLGKHGWKTTRLRSYMTDVAEFAGERIAKAAAAAAKRPPRSAPMPPMDDPTGVHLFLHSSVH